MLSLLILMLSFVGTVLMFVQLLQGYDNFERSLTGLAAWAQDILDDPEQGSTLHAVLF